jgi:hypothetical protein
MQMRHNVVFTVHCLSYFYTLCILILSKMQFFFLTRMLLVNMCVRGHVSQKFCFELKMLSTEVFFSGLEFDDSFSFHSLCTVFCVFVRACACVHVCRYNKHFTFRQLDGEVYLVVILHMKHTL